METIKLVERSPEDQVEYYKKLWFEEKTKVIKLRIIIKTIKEEMQKGNYIRIYALIKKALEDKLS